MTTTPIEKLAGRELDAAVHAEVLGQCPHFIEFDPTVSDEELFSLDYTPKRCRDCHKPFSGLMFTAGLPACPDYSTSLDACAAVIDHLHQTGWAVLAYRPPAHHSKDPNDPVCWSVSLGIAGEDGMRMPVIRRSLAEAVCVAALAAVRGGGSRCLKKNTGPASAATPSRPLTVIQSWPCSDFASRSASVRYTAGSGCGGCGRGRRWLWPGRPRRGREKRRDGTATG